MSEICVVHLVRKSNGIAPLERFLESYLRYPAGVPHDLLVVFKGFLPGREPESYRARLRGVPHKAMYVWDYGFDIRPYMKAARIFDHAYFCFLNSYSVILAGDWLSKMHAHVCREGVGIVGATGSCESAYSVNLNAQGLGPPPALPIAFFRALRLRALRAWFDPFPNNHIRTNAFIVPRSVIRATRFRTTLNKLDALRFESGRNGLTRQVMNMGLRALVVGKDGKAYESGNWLASNTYRAGDQHNLLVADNQTAAYLQCNAQTRGYLSRCAWGEEGPPILPVKERA